MVYTLPKIQITRPVELKKERIDIESNIPERFYFIADRFPENTAILTDEISFSYSQLKGYVNQIAKQIPSTHAEERLPVAVFSTRNHFVIAAILAVWASGRPVVVLEPSNPFQRNAEILNNSKAAAILADEDSKKNAIQLARRKRIEVIVSGEWNANDFSRPKVEINPCDAAAIVYTSGTTGKPKGVFTSHRNLLHATRRASESLQINHSDRWLLTAALSHNGGIMGVLRTMMNGAALYPQNINEGGPRTILKKIADYQVTIYHSVPAVFRQVAALMTGEEQIPHLRWVLLGGDRLFRNDVELFQERFPDTCTLINQLGCTELSGYSQFIIHKGTKVLDDHVPVGKPLDDIRIRVVNHDGIEVDEGEEGFIELESEFLADGFWRDPELTKQKFMPSKDDPKVRVYQPGDRGMILPDRNLVHLGRLDREINIRGFRFNLEAVERELRHLDAVGEALVVQIPAKEQDMHIAAYVTPSGGEHLQADDVRRELMMRLPSYMVPNRVIVLDSLPLRANGKIDRGKLPSIKPDRPEIRTPYSAPIGRDEKKLAEIWERTLNIHPVGRDDSFFDLGGDSLQAAMLFVEIEREFKQKMPLSILMYAATVSEQSKILSKIDLDKMWSPLVTVRREGTLPPLFCFPGRGGNPIQFHHLAQHLDARLPVYMLQSRGLGGEIAPYRRMEDITPDFIQHIREIQPKGPYYLIGSSFGGKVAYDIAQNLTSEGESVVLLAMVDTYGPGYPRYVRNLSQTRKYIYKLAQYLGKHIGNLKTADWKERYTYITHYLKQIRRRIKNLRNAATARRLRSKLPPEFAAVERANSLASTNYNPKEYKGRVVLFRARQQPWGVVPDPTLGWGTVRIGKLDVHEIPGHHGSILFEPRVKFLAQIFNQYLNSSEQ